MKTTKVAPRPKHKPRQSQNQSSIKDFLKPMTQKTTKRDSGSEEIQPNSNSNSKNCLNVMLKGKGGAVVHNNLGDSNYIDKPNLGLGQADHGKPTQDRDLD